MLFKSALVSAALAVVGVAATHPSLFPRQFATSDLPAACQQRCSAPLGIYEQCAGGDQAGCMRVCEADNYTAFIGCMQCIVDEEVGGMSAQEQSLLDQLVQGLEEACADAGMPVPSATITGSPAPSGSAIGSGTSSPSRPTSLTQSAGGGPGPSDLIASLSSASGALASASASASPSGAALVGKPINFGLGGAAIAAVGVVLGAAAVF